MSFWSMVQNSNSVSCVHASHCQTCLRASFHLLVAVVVVSTLGINNTKNDIFFWSTRNLLKQLVFDALRFLNLLSRQSTCRSSWHRLVVCGVLCWILVLTYVGFLWILLQYIYVFTSLAIITYLQSLPLSLIDGFYHLCACVIRNSSFGTHGAAEFRALLEELLHYAREWKVKEAS